LIRNLQFWFETPGPYSFPVLRIRIRDPVPFWPLVPGSGMDKKSRSGSGTNNPDHISESLDKTLWVLKNPNFFMRTREQESLWPCFPDGKIRNRNATSGFKLYGYSFMYQVLFSASQWRSLLTERGRDQQKKLPGQLTLLHPRGPLHKTSWPRGAGYPTRL
jgi:hypothetical protein